MPGRLIWLGAIDCSFTHSSATFLLGCLRSAAQPNKVYVGGLPEGARQEDLQTCFGKIGNIVDIDPEAVRIGMKVMVAWDDVRPGLTIPRFASIERVSR